MEYICEKCNKCFTRKSNYEKHKKRKTPCSKNIMINETLNDIINETLNVMENLKIDVNNVSPLRYPGGKTRACKKLNDIINEYFDINKFNNVLSPFFGGGSFEFYIQNYYKLNIIANDKFKPLHSFWISCKSNVNKLCDMFTEKIDLIDKEQFLDIRSKIMEENDTLLQGFMYFIINRCSFSGATLSGGFSLESSKKRFTKSSIDKIKNLKLELFNIYNLDKLIVFFQ